MILPRGTVYTDAELGIMWMTPSWSGYQVITVQWVFFVISTVLVGIRLYVQRSVIGKRPWGEVYTILALLFLLATDICYTLEKMWHFFNFEPAYMFKWYPGIEEASKVVFVNEVFFFFTSIYCCKAALLCFYSELAPERVFPKTRLAIKVTWLFLAAGTLNQVFFRLFACMPISTNWTGSCFSPTYYIVNNSLHIVSDVMVYAIPFIILYYLKNLSHRKKIEAGLLFGLGLVNIGLAAFTYAVVAVHPYPLPTEGYWQLGCFLFGHALQHFTAVTIICAPYVRKFFRGASLSKAKAAMFRGPVSSGPDSIISPAARVATEGALAAERPEKLEIGIVKESSDVSTGSL